MSAVAISLEISREQTSTMMTLEVVVARQQRTLLLDRSEQSHLRHRFANMVFWGQIEEISEEARFGFPPPSRLLRFL